MSAHQTPRQSRRAAWNALHFVGCRIMNRRAPSWRGDICTHCGHRRAG